MVGTKAWHRVKEDLRTDYTWNRVGRYSVRAARRLPTGTAHYVIDKVPMMGWLPKYNPRWLLNDFIAGLTLGLMLIPQGLAYAKIATIPVDYGLQSSWLPAAIYAVMGSTKDLSTGPTSLIGLTTAEVVKALVPQGYTPQEVASAVAMSMGVYGIILGFLNLGFLLEFISLPILSGFISAVALLIGLNQVPSLLGETNVSSDTAPQIRDIFRKLPQANGYACAVGFTGILFMVVMEQAGKRWAAKNRIIWALSISRAFLCLVLFTGVSYAVNRNKHPKDYLFAVVEVSSHGIPTPQVPSSKLFAKAFPRAIAAFIGSILEHLAIARAFGVKNNYVSDQTQELCYYGVTNLFNSFFHTMGVGAAMSRTSVNSQCQVKSPLSGFVTMAVILLCIFKLSDTLYWIPKATLAAIIITAVAPLVQPPRTFYHYWKTSLADWMASMLALFLCFFVSTEVGLGASVGFNIVYVLIRQVFIPISQVGHTDSDQEAVSELQRSFNTARGLPTDLSPDVRVIRFNESLFYPNAYRLKVAVLDIVQTHHSPAYSNRHGEESERNWSVQGEKHLKRLRKKAKITDPDGLPPINVLVLDMVKVNHLDTTAIQYLKQLINEVKLYGGKGVEIRFASLSEMLRVRFERANFTLAEGENIGDEDGPINVLHCFPNVAEAVRAPRQEDVEILEKEADKVEQKETV